MDIVFVLQGTVFEWDAEKARANVEKHGVAFEEAAEAFFDPFYQTGDASRGGEARDFLIGYSLSERLLLVVHVERSDRVRIVSARQATRTEKKEYENA